MRIATTERTPGLDSDSALKHYDAVVVGSSPVCYVTALAEEAAGKRVLMVDAAESVGGTWKTIDMLGFSNVELGCHEIDADKGSYGLMTRLGVPLSVMKPQPTIYSVSPRFFPKSISFKNRWIRDLYDVATGTKNYDLPWSKHLSVTTKARGFYRIARYAMRSWKPGNFPAKYPPGGAMQIISRLDTLARQAGIEVRCSTRIANIALDRDAGLVRFELNGEPTTASILHLTSHSTVGLIADGDKQIDLNPARNLWQTLYLVLSDCGPVNFAYLVMAKPKLIHRASDLSRYAVPGPGRENTRLIALTIEETSEETEATARESLRQMQAWGLISEQAKLEDYAFLPYHFTRVNEYERPGLEHALDPFIKIHESNLLTRSIKLLMQDVDTEPLVERAQRLSEAALAS